MIKYPKIQSVFKRDPNNNYRTFLQGQYSIPEFDYLAECPWEWTEKVDGTNIRASVKPSEAPGELCLVLGGRTDKAQIPPFLEEALAELIDPYKIAQKFPVDEAEVVLFGEGYGPRIQKVGKLYRDTPGFVLFDVYVNGWWLRREDVEEVAEELGLDVVPLIGHSSLRDLVDECREGFASRWGDFPAEGIVARPCVELKTRRGDRIITKCKLKDFEITQ